MKKLGQATFWMLVFSAIFATISAAGASDLPDTKAHDLNRTTISKIEKSVRAQPFSFAFLGDSRNTPTFTAMIQQLNNDKLPSFAIIGGDVVDSPDQAAFATFLKQQAAIKIPTLLLAGNHDVEKRDSSMYRQIFGPQYYSFTVANAKFIVLDDSNKTDLGSTQMAWLKKQLQQGANNQYRFVFMHVPPWDPQVAVGETGHAIKDTDAAEGLMKMLRQYKVDLIFASHIHAYYETSRNGLKMIISGGAGANLDGDDSQHAFLHYMRVTVTDSGIKTAAIPLQSGQ